MSGRITTPLRPPIRRALAGAAGPMLGGHLAAVRRGETRLGGIAPRPLVVAVLAVGPQPGASTLVALLAQAFAGLAPDRVAVLDADGVHQPQRFRLGTDDGGSLRQLVADPHAWRFRRTVERYLARGAGVPLLAAALPERGQVLDVAQLRAGLQVLRRRYPVVLIDVPAQASADVLAWAVRAADHVIITAWDSAAAAPALQWLNGIRTDEAHVTVAARAAHGVARGIDVVMPDDASLAGYGQVRILELRLPALAAVEQVTARLTTSWARDS